MATSTHLDRIDKRPESGKTSVTVHPLVLLSVVDHYNRACRDTGARAVGVLLGSWKSATELDIANSFAVPFEEDSRNPDIWFIDHDFLANMFGMFRKVNAKERIVGWYHTGPKLRAGDIAINEVIRRFVAHPVLVIVDVVPNDYGLPTRAYVAVEEVHDDGTPASKTFEHIACEMGAEEAEEVGVEHLLRDITDATSYGSLSSKIQGQVASLHGLAARLGEIHEYLNLVADGKLPMNHAVLYTLQDVFNLVPNLHLDSFVRSFSLRTSDQMLVVYLSSLIRATLALHALINNKIELQEAERKEAQLPKRKPKMTKPKRSSREVYSGRGKGYRID
eukprot:UC1_evm2s1784